MRQATARAFKVGGTGLFSGLVVKGMPERLRIRAIVAIVVDVNSYYLLMVNNSQPIDN